MCDKVYAVDWYDGDAYNTYDVYKTKEYAERVAKMIDGEVFEYTLNNETEPIKVPYTVLIKDNKVERVYVNPGIRHPAEEYVEFKLSYGFQGRINVWAAHEPEARIKAMEIFKKSSKEM